MKHVALAFVLLGSSFANAHNHNSEETSYCYARAYRPKHLRTYPDQTIESFQLKLAHIENSESINFSFAASGVEVVGTDGTAPWTGYDAGQCEPYDGAAYICKGNKANSGSFILSWVRNPGGISMINQNNSMKVFTCDSEDKTCAINIEGPENKEFWGQSIPCL